MRRIINSKRGLAEIITLILIILLSLAAIAIIWQVIKPVLLKTTSQISLVCTTGLDIKIDSANCSGSTWEVKVSRGVGEGKIKTLKFVFSSDSGSETREFSALTPNPGGDSPVGMPGELADRVYKFSKTGLPVNTTKVKLAPVVEGEGGSDIPCPVLSTVDCRIN
jgi:hypothetical protein